MNKVAHYLQEHVAGEVMTSSDSRHYFATDNSIFTITPSVIVYPKNENDVRKTARFCWQLAERGRVIPITARGSGTDLTGAAIGSGVILAFPAHLNKVQYLEPKESMITVQAGINFGKLQQLLMTYDRYLPAAPTSLEYSTVGGAVANNASGMRSLKYGDMRSYVRGLRVVLANGEVIETGRISKRELSKKLGLTSFEGEIYRALDTLLEENKAIVGKSIRNVTKNSSGYDLADVKTEDGSFDLTPLFVGSQGTLGLVTEITLDAEPMPAEPSLLVAHLDDPKAVTEAVIALRQLDELPSAIELIDGGLLSAAESINANYLKEVIQPPYPAFVLLVEISDAKEHKQKKCLKKAQKILSGFGQVTSYEDSESQQAVWKLREVVSLYSGHNQGLLKPLPLIDDGIVPVDMLGRFITELQAQFKKENLPLALWGHAGDGNIHVQPLLNLGQVGDRQKAFRMLAEHHRHLSDMGGSYSGQYNDGRLRGPFLDKLYSDDVFQLFRKVKQIFDPYGILNPGVKINVSLDDVKRYLRSDYTLDHLYDHLPLS